MGCPRICKKIFTNGSAFCVNADGQQVRRTIIVRPSETNVLEPSTAPVAMRGAAAARGSRAASTATVGLGDLPTQYARLRRRRVGESAVICAAKITRYDDSGPPSPER
ncbi:hypothetical protein Q0Z83_000190 [Actinoplanes sichuanensis]|nr:hypothetical protein Q0Z83_000190 [Actinoplanes sichuanensis]